MIDFPDLQDAIACPVGICADCNGNSILDQCDLDCDSSCGGCNVSGCGESLDCNSNGVPDECDITHGTDPDCNSNDIPDECDIADQSSRDCDENGVPDECHASTQERVCCYGGDQCTVTTALCCDALSGVLVEEQSTCQYGPCTVFGP